MRLILAAVLCSACSALALDIGHTRLPEKLRFAPEGTELLLNGARRIRIVMLREVTAKQMTDSLLGVMHKNNGKAELAAVQAGINEFQALLGR